MTPRRPSARTRAKAIFVADVTASSRGDLFASTFSVAYHLGFGPRVASLVCAARDAVNGLAGLRMYAHHGEDAPWIEDADAAGLLRDGWSPGDVIRRLP